MTVMPGPVPASARTSGVTPCAASITTAPSGTSSSSSDEDRPHRLETLDDVRLCTIWRRTYTGGPNRTSARSTISMARSTPAQNERGAASRMSRGPRRASPAFEARTQVVQGTQSGDPAGHHAHVGRIGDRPDDGEGLGGQ